MIKRVDELNIKWKFEIIAKVKDPVKEIEDENINSKIPDFVDVSKLEKNLNLQKQMIEEHLKNDVFTDNFDVIIKVEYKY